MIGAVVRVKVLSQNPELFWMIGWEIEPRNSDFVFQNALNIQFYR